MLNTWHAYPMIRVLLPLAGGIWCGSACPCRPSWLLLVVLLGLLWLAAVYRYRQASLWSGSFGWLLFGWLFLFGWSYVQYRDVLRDPAHWQYAQIEPSSITRWEGRIANVKYTEAWIRLTVHIHGWNPEGEDLLYPIRGRMMVYVPEASAVGLSPGMHFSFTGAPQPIAGPMDPVGFDWRRYLYIRGIGHQLFLRDDRWEAMPPQHFLLTAYSATKRKQFQAILAQHLTDPLALQLAGAMILGARDELSDAMNEAYQASGAVHILAVSGLHVGLVAGMVLGLLGYVIRQKRFYWMRALIAMSVVWGYILVTGMPDSAVRAGVLFSFIIVGRTLSRHAEALNLLAAAVVLLLLVHPWILHHVGFQLSVLAVAGILFFHPVLYRAWYPSGRVPLFFWNLFCVTLAAQLATVMLSLFYFHRFPVYFVLAGLFVVPLSGAFLGTGVATILLHGFSPALAAWCSKLMLIISGMMNGLVFGIAELPGSTLQDLYPHVWWIALLPLGSGLIMAAFVQRRAMLLLAGCAVLVAGLVAEAAERVRVRALEKPYWAVIARQDRPPELLFVQGEQKLALVLSDETLVPQRSSWPGYGQVWEVASSGEFDFGQLWKRGDLIVFGGDTISLNQGSSAPFLVARQPPLGHLVVDAHTVILPPDMSWKDRRAWSRVANDSTLHDMRVQGYWQRTLP